MAVTPITSSDEDTESQSTNELVVGDLTHTGEQPLFDQVPPHDHAVVVNVSYARHEKGARAMRVVSNTGEVLLALTAAQAHQLAIDLHEAADYVAVQRQKSGFSS